MSSVAGPDGPRTVLVAGLAGGVGTTTVAALLAVAWAQAGGCPTLVDHSGGSLASRLPAAWAPAGVPDLTIDDRGAHAARAAEVVAGQPDSVLVVVASATPASLALLPQLLDRCGAGPVRLVLAQVHGSHRLPRGSVPAVPGPALTIPRDDALAAGGAIDWAFLGRRTRAAASDLAALL